MATIGKWISVANHNWYRNNSSTICPQPMQITLSGHLGFEEITIEFNGRGRVGIDCPGSDVYVTPGSGITGAFVDVWAAYRAGVWTSSVDIEILLSHAFPPYGLTVRARPRNASPVATKAVTLSELAGVCPILTLATVTVYEDGTWSIA